MDSEQLYLKDGKIHVKGRHGERWADFYDEEGRIGGGYRVRPVLKEQDGEVVVTHEVVNTASGAYFTSGTDFGFSVNQPAFRSAVSDRKEFIREGYRLWKYDPLGGIIVNLTTFFIMGRGITINYDSNVAEEVLKKFWKKNRMYLRAKQICDEGTAFGENYFKLKVHKREVRLGRKVLWRPGDVEVSIVDPLNVDAIEHAAGNVNNVYRYYLTYTGENDQEIQEKVPDISKFNPDVDDACILHVKFNSASNDVFGISDLVRVKEWLDNYQEFLRDGVVINKLYRSPCYDITIKDGTDDDILAAKRRYSGWKIGSNPVHNDKEEWNILEFTGVNASAEDSRRALLLIVAAGVGMPEYMLADGSNSNMATTQSQQLPAIKKFEDRQDTYKETYLEIFDFVLNMKYVFGSVEGLKPVLDFEGDPWWPGDINFPVIAQEDDSSVAETAISLKDAGLIAKSTAALRNGSSFDKELTRMAEDSEKLAKAYIETLKKVKAVSGINDETAKAIVRNCFPGFDDGSSNQEGQGKPGGADGQGGDKPSDRKPKAEPSGKSSTSKDD